MKNKKNSLKPYSGSLDDFYFRERKKDSKNFRLEDAHKWSRLVELNKRIGLPICQFRTIEASKLKCPRSDFMTLLGKSNRELLTLRFKPKKANLLKIRIRGVTPDEAYRRFKQQKINLNKYSVDILPYAGEKAWSFGFMVTRTGIYGEIIRGGREKLAWGEVGRNRVVPFRFDFKRLVVEDEDPQKMEVISMGIDKLFVDDAGIRKILREKLGTWFYQKYVGGYFEVALTDHYGMWFVDYNRVLGRKYADFKLCSSGPDRAAVLRGRAGCQGRVVGVVRIVKSDKVLTNRIEIGEILVCEMTTPEYLPLMKRAGGIITDRGGILSHPAIIARELNKPCLVATGKATKLLKDGQVVVLDANKGTVRLIERSRNVH